MPKTKTLDPQEIVQDDKNKKPNSDKVCIFCQGYADSGKVLNCKVVPLCREDYLTQSLGKVAQRLREIDG